MEILKKTHYLKYISIENQEENGYWGYWKSKESGLFKLV